MGTNKFVFIDLIWPHVTSFQRNCFYNNLSEIPTYMAKPSLFLATTALLLHFFAIFGGMWSKINQTGTSNTKVVLF